MTRRCLAFGIALLVLVTSCSGQWQVRGQTCRTAFYFNCEPDLMARLTALSHRAATFGDYDEYLDELEKTVKLTTDDLNLLFITDELAQIYTYHKVDFQRAVERNQSAVTLLKKLQGADPTSVVGTSSFFPQHRLSYTPINKAPSIPLPPEFLSWASEESLNRVARRITNRTHLLATLLGEPPTDEELVIPAPEIGRISPQEARIWDTAMKSTGSLGLYRRRLEALELLWRHGPRTSTAWEVLREAANDALEAERILTRVPWDLGIRLRYIAGVAEIETGHLSEGIKKLTQLEILYEKYEQQLQKQILDAKAAGDAQVSKQRSWNTAATLGMTVLAGLLVPYGGAAGVQGSLIGQGVGEDITLQTHQGNIRRLEQFQARGLSAFFSEHEQITLYYYTGFGLQSLGLPQEAITKYKLAVGMIEQQRTTIAGEGQRIRFLEEKERVYERLIPLLLQGGDVDEAFAYMERARSRAFVDLLASVSPQFGTHEEAEAYRVDVRTYAERDLLAEKNGMPPPKTQNILEAGRGVQVVADEFVKDSKTQIQRSPEFRSLLAVQTADVQEIARILGETTALVSFFVTSESTAVILLQDGKFKGWLMPLGRTDLLHRVNQIRKLISPGQSIENIQQTTERFYVEVLRAAFSAIKKQRVYLVPHGPLHHLPFAAVYDGTRYLIDRFVLLTVPSATVLTYLEQKRRGLAGPTVVFANPDLTDPQFALPHAEQEAARIKKHRHDAVVQMGKAATKQHVWDLSPKASILHFATHASFDAERPLNSAILLSPSESEDGRLLAREVFGLQLHGGLVVLSGCETGLATITSGDEIIGMTRAFMYAGTPQIIATLWPIEDEATAVLMDHFYNQLSSHPAEDSLQQTQIAIRSEYPHPFYWAAFTVFGLAAGPQL